ncbi:pilus assembly protein N-terminal domain-containing protein [Methylobacterium sp. NEAU 140]|uniref:pilus assembly protein N-terminal domain-containing protein n=1 Tax=Methylobacterium sp. NEAU 140 TaxID=3064945 RepID=UPI002735E90C|nr:pilus assembly protein N-terminal domain-containing protein [Methylobacterium sp. NEAU 140]MDP4023548.1 pilus assembly protein N-terminal domain-containing protein [Methylobacterium sp. NEAU 140]
MRRSLWHAGRAGLALLSVAALAGPGAAAGQPETLPVVTVLVDNAKVIRLPERTQTIIVGNPFIAEVTPQKNGVLVLTGKSFGSTNLIALDAAGTLIAETTIRVEASREATITVQRGLERESLSCTPNCQPSAQLGDAAGYFGTVSGQADTRRRLATGGGGGGAGGGTPMTASAAPDH